MCRRWIEWFEKRIAQTGSTEYMVEQIQRYQSEMRHNPKPIDFLAMIRLADIAPHSSLVGLPDRGALLFFYDVERNAGSFWADARGGWRILFVESEDELVVVDDPPIRRPNFHPCTLMFELEYVLPQDIRDQTGDDDLYWYGDEDYTRVCATLRGNTDMITHQLGGVPDEVQNGLFETCQLASNGVDCGSSDEVARHGDRYWELKPGAKDWRLVLQIDSDDAGPDWMWGDCGRLYYCLHRDDLAARRFDRSWCVEQCH